MAYFCVEADKQSIPTVKAQDGSLPSPFSYHLVWIDNDESHNQFSSNTFSLEQSSNSYLYAFYMPILEIITQQRSVYTVSDFSIDNLLYANLKLERLINEYIGLKEKSKSILENLEVPFIARSSGFGSKLIKNGSTISNQIENIDQHIKLLAGPSVSGSRTSNFNKSYNRQQDKQSDSHRSLHSMRQPLKYSLNSTFKKNRTAKTGSDTNKDFSGEGSDYSAEIDDQLPFIERMGRSLMDYIKSNKIKFIIYIVVFYGLFHILFKGRRR
jgi:hypothetical protein